MYVYVYIYGDINYQKWWTMREVPWRKEAKAPYLCVFVAVFNEWIFISAERWYMQLWVWFTRMALEALEMLEAATVLYDTSVEWYALGFLLFEL